MRAIPLIPLIAAGSLVFLVAEARADDGDKKHPPVVEPQYDGKPVPAPKGAVILFDGKKLVGWQQEPRGKKGQPKKKPTEPKWKIGKGFMEVVPGTGFLRTKKPVITSGLLHIEWATPAEVTGEGQGRGNSGVFIAGFPEVQVLDSWHNVTYPDGQAAALYKKSIPSANASRKPGEWQCYDIFIERAIVKDGKITRPARITVKHNNVLVQDGIEFQNKTQEGTLGLQDHKNPVRYRNIWFEPMGAKK
jgi:hypothetical protein